VSLNIEEAVAVSDTWNIILMGERYNRKHQIYPKFNFKTAKNLLRTFPGMT
jgi:hypothetical protein